MTPRDAIDLALDGVRAGGTAQIEGAGTQTEIEVVESDRLGVKVRRIRVERDRAYDVEALGDRWPKTVRQLPDRLKPVEIEPRLGGATLRSDPEDRVDDTFMEVEVRDRAAEVQRQRTTPAGREASDWSMTREQLRGLLDALSEDGAEEP
ncbi:MAG: hypothetical protein EA397_16335 [Deltaproteobacteria bacterium]|nr:MAG: hypothetical protein EA397_16335 [Deltaproteobacteria bacterium]